MFEAFDYEFCLVLVNSTSTYISWRKINQLPSVVIQNWFILTINNLFSKSLIRKGHCFLEGSRLIINEKCYKIWSDASSSPLTLTTSLIFFILYIFLCFILRSFRPFIRVNVFIEFSIIWFWLLYCNEYLDVQIYESKSDMPYYL